MNLGAIAAKGAVVTIAGQLCRFALQATSMVLLARWLEPGAFGLIAMVTAVTGLAAVLSDFGLSMAYIQASNVNHQERSNMFWTNTALGLLLFGIVFFGAEQIAAFYREPELVSVIQTLAFVFLITSCTAQHRAELSKKFAFKRLAGCDIVAAAFGTAAALLLAHSGAGYWALVAQHLVMSLCTGLFLLHAIPWRPLPPRQLSNLVPFLRYGLNTSLVQLLNYFTANADNLLIGRRWGATELGYYERAFHLFRAPLNQVAAPMTRVAVPVLSRAECPTQFAELLLKGRLVLFSTVGLAFLFVSANASPVIQLILGDGWQKSSKVLSILTLGGVFQALAYPYFWAFLARSRTGLQLKFAVFTKIVSLTAMVIGLNWGVTGVAWAVAAGNLMNWLVLTLIAMPLLGLERQVLVMSAVRPAIWISAPALFSYGLGSVEIYAKPVAALGLSVGIYCVWIAGTLGVSRRTRRQLTAAVTYIRGK